MYPCSDGFAGLAPFGECWFSISKGHNKKAVTYVSVPLI